MKKYFPFLIAALALSLVLYTGDRYVLHIATMFTIMGILALSMHLMLRIGQLSIAHGAFMGIGAYTSAILTMRTDISPPIALFLGALFAMITAVAVGRYFLRIKAVYFVLLTYAFGQVVNLIFQEWTSLFGGNNGIHGIGKFSLFGVRFADPAAYLIFTSAFFVACFMLVRAIFSSSIGVVLASIDEDEDLCRSLGTNALSWRTLIFAVSAGMAGLAGGLYAHHIGFLSPAAFGFMLSVDLVVMNIVGGVLSPWGAVIGAFILVLLPELLRGIREYQMLAYGAILLICLIYFKDGIIGIVKKHRRAQ